MRRLTSFCLFTAALAISCNAHGAPVSKPAFVLTEAAYVAVHSADCLQTARIQRTAGVYEAEIPWMIGKKPSTRSVIGWCAAEFVAHGIVSYSLKNNELAFGIWQGLTIGMTYDTVWHNGQLGLGVKF